MSGTISSRGKRLLLIGGLLGSSIALVHAESSAEVFPQAQRATIASGRQHSLVVTEDGTLWAFGRNNHGQLGHFLNVGSNIPVSSPVPVMPDIVAVSAGNSHSLALQNDGTLWSFGDNTVGELGTGDVDALPHPPATVMTGVKAISAGGSTSFALKTDGTLWAWGYNFSGQLGDVSTSGTSTAHVTPVQVLSDVAAMDAGGVHTLVLKTDGTVWSFGDNEYGQLGRTAEFGAHPTPTQIPGLTDVVAVAAGDYHSLVLKDDGTVWSFGRNDYGQLGNGTSDTDPHDVPTQVLSGMISISADGNQSFGLGYDTLLWSAGFNEFGQLARSANNGTSNPNPTFTDVLEIVTEVGSGSDQTLVLLDDGTLLTFGSNEYGQLGNGSADGDPHPSGANPMDFVLQPDTYISLAPARLMDTRPTGETVDGRYDADGLRTAGMTTEVEVTGRAGVPIDADAIALNVTAANAVTNGFVTVYPCGMTRPDASNLNFVANKSVPNSVIVAIGNEGKICFYNSAPTQLIVDVTGFYPATSTFQPLFPGRAMDTRANVGPVGLRAADSTICIQVADTSIPGPEGLQNIPDDAAAVVLNVTVASPEGNGFVTVFPEGESRPNASNLNFVAGRSIANQVITPVGEDGLVCFYTSAATHLIADISGYFHDSSTYVALSPDRWLDTRVPPSATVDGTGAGGGPRAAGSTTQLQITGRGDVPLYAQSVTLNVTVSQPQSGGFVTVYPCGSPQPNASNLNFSAGQTVPNTVIAKIGVDGKVCIFTSAATNLIVDVSGYYGLLPSEFPEP